MVGTGGGTETEFWGGLAKRVVREGFCLHTVDEEVETLEEGSLSKEPFDLLLVPDIILPAGGEVEFDESEMFQVDMKYLVLKYSLLTHHF